MNLNKLSRWFERSLNDFLGIFFTVITSCRDTKMLNHTAESGNYVIDPDGEGGLPPFDVTCDMNGKNGVGVTVRSVTIVRTEHWWMDATLGDVTHVTFITQERVCLSWRVSSKSPYAASSLSSISVLVQSCFTITIHTDGGCHMLLLKWPTGAEHLPVGSAHAVWPTRLQIPVMVVAVMQTTRYSVKTAVSSLTKHIFLWNSSSLGILAPAKQATTHCESWSAME